MRAESAAALANFLMIFLITVCLMVAAEPWNEVVYSSPIKAVFQGVAMAILVATPIAAFAAGRTLVHARGYVRGETAGWRGVLEAGALGCALTLPFVLPGVVARQFNPGEWGQPRAFMLGLGYVGAYGFLGLLVGLILGFLLWLSAIAALRVHRRITS